MLLTKKFIVASLTKCARFPKRKHVSDSYVYYHVLIATGKNWRKNSLIFFQICSVWIFYIGSEQIQYIVNKEKHNPGSQEGKVGWHLSEWLRADCLDLGGNWQPEDLSRQEVSTDHLRGCVWMQTDAREGWRNTHDDETRLSLFYGTETHRGAES